MEGSCKKRVYVNGALIALNILYFLYLEIGGSSQDSMYMYEKGAMFAPAVLIDKEYYRLLTAMFMHFGISHIVNNMVVLFAVGDYLERAMGHVKYLAFYLACGIGSNWISMAAKGMDFMTVSAGASGAIFGVVGGLLCVVFENRGRVEDLSARQLVVMVAFSMFLGLNDRQVDNVAHASGLILGLVFGLILYRRPKKNKIRDGGLPDEKF